ncbi:MAG: glycosyltransferase [Candidatus Nomurabacteria bacterium]|nr:MAG: glycosyltransferase [Candidatus Nomurabacteria bacterium]
MTKRELSLSIILPLFNASEDIDALFTCLSRQVSIDKASMEIIIVNDGSTDTTMQVVENSRNLLSGFFKINIVEHSSNIGLAKTRLDGAKSAKGKYLTFIDKKCRPDNDYLISFINKNRNIVIGNPYINKSRSLWARVLTLIRKRIYYPYFNHPFDDIILDHAAYKKFKNKGGGGSMYVLRTYYLRVAKNMPTGKHVNDDSLFIEQLSKIEPILKTSSAKIEYLNRSGFTENIIHLYGRGPKFVDFYAKPGRRFFIPIVVLIVFMVINIAFLFLLPKIVLYELLIFIVLVACVSLYLSENYLDFLVSVILLPIALVAFSCGTLKGLLLKAFRLY